MIKFLFAPQLFIFPFNFQEHWRCLDEGLYDLISIQINTKSCKYTQILSKDDAKIKINSKATLVLTQRDVKNGNYILFEKKKYLINDKLSKNHINYNYYLHDMYSFKNKEGTCYLLQLSTSNGLNLNSNTFNLIILFSKTNYTFLLLNGILE